MTFTITPLLSGGVLVEGTDSKGTDGRTVLKSERWDMVKHLRTHKVAQEQFDLVVKEFFAPLTDAADVAKAQLAGPASDYANVVITQGVDGVDEEVVELDMEGVIIRMLEEGQHDKLRWVNYGTTLVATV